MELLNRFIYYSVKKLVKRHSTPPYKFFFILIIKIDYRSVQIKLKLVVCSKITNHISDKYFKTQFKRSLNK